MSRKKTKQAEFAEWDKDLEEAADEINRLAEEAQAELQKQADEAQEAIDRAIKDNSII